MNPSALVVNGLSKSYGRSRVLSAVDLTVDPGSVRALLGPNGAGKSTLIGCLSGATSPDAGSVRLGGVELVGETPAQVRRSGLSVIYQSFSLVGPMSVVDNIFLGDELCRGPFIDRSSQRTEAQRLLSDLGISVNPDAMVDDLSVGAKQLVEIAKAEHHQAKVLVLDEPTAALSDRETTVLLDHVRRLADSGVAVLYVSHRLNEIVEIADCVTVLRDGVVVEAGPIQGHNTDSLAAAISPGLTELAATEVGSERRSTRLRARGVSCTGAGPVDLEVAEGEILALFGLLGAGRTELLETMVGLTSRTGSVEIDGQALPVGSIRKAISAGLMLVPGDRKTGGIFEPFTAAENVVLPHQKTLAGNGFRQTDAEARMYSRVVEALNIQPANHGILASSLSGGNQQKLVLGRWLPAEGLRVLLLDEPTQGVDVGARVELYRSLQSLAADRVSIVFATSEPEEAILLAHRIVVMYQGEIVMDVMAAEADEASLLHAAQTPLNPIERS